MSSSELTSCAPAAVGEKFLVGDIFMVPSGEPAIVKSIEFAESTGVKITEQAALTTADTGGYYLYPLAAIGDDAAAAAEWAARTVLPADAPIDTIDEPDHKGVDMQRAAIVAVVERTGDETGFLRSPQIVYEVRGVTHRAVGTMKYWLNNGPCSEDEAEFASTGYGKSTAED